MVKLENPTHFNLRTIMSSGQCFRIFEVEPNLFDVLSMNHWVRIAYDDKNNVYFFYCDEDEFSYWKYYFDLDTDYEPFFNTIMTSDDEFLKSAATYGNGMRILRQNYWEMIISFIISQNNNIPRIKKSIEAFCKKFGKLMTKGDITYYSFPYKMDVDKIELEDLSDLGLGYRDKYVYNIFKTHERELSNRDELLKLPGIGPKVASCITLFGCHKMDSYPIDTWIRKMIDEMYGGNFNTTPYKGFEGFIQQLQFYYYRSLKGKN